MKQGSRSQSPKRPKSGQGAGSKKLECEKDELAKKLQSISQRLSEIQSEKRKLSPLSRPSTAPKKETSEKKTKPHKREFFHPKLEFIMAEAAYSPYLTPPTASYGKKTLHYPFKMKEIRFQGRDPIPEEGFPVDIDFAKRRFVKEIINFKPRFEFHEEKTNLPLQYLEPLPNLYIPDVHAKPRRESMVFPNSYQPLKGHRGKIPAHLRAYLDYDPSKPETAPAKKITEAEAQELIKELTEARSPSPIRRVGSGSYQAHGARGGPNKYKEDLKYRKAVKEFVRMLSNASGQGDSHGSDDDDAYFLEELEPAEPATSKDHYEPQLESVKEPNTDEPFIFQEATLLIKKIQVKNLQSKSVYGAKEVYVSIKSGKIHTCQTEVISNPPTVVNWESSPGDYRMSVPVSPLSIQNLKLKISVLNKSKGKNRPDILFGSHTLKLSDDLIAAKFKKELSYSFDIKNNTETGGKVTIFLELLEGNLVENVEPESESKVESSEPKKKKELSSNKIPSKPKVSNKLPQELPKPKKVIPSKALDDKNSKNSIDIKSKNPPPIISTEDNVPSSEKSVVSLKSLKEDKSTENGDNLSLENEQGDVFDLDAYLKLSGEDNESTTSSKGKLTSLPIASPNEDDVPISVDNFFDALSSDDGSNVVGGNSTIQYFENNQRKQIDEDDDDKLYDDFDDEYKDEDFAEANESSPPIAVPMKIGRQLTMYESDENYDDFENGMLENESETKAPADNRPAADEASVEYGGDGFDNESETKAPADNRPAADEASVEYGGEGFDNESETKTPADNRPAADEASVEYGGDGFDNESETKAPADNRPAADEASVEYGGDGFDNQGEIKVEANSNTDDDYGDEYGGDDFEEY